VNGFELEYRYIGDTPTTVEREWFATLPEAYDHARDLVDDPELGFFVVLSILAAARDYTDLTMRSLGYFRFFYLKTTKGTGIRRAQDMATIINWLLDHHDAPFRVYAEDRKHVAPISDDGYFVAIDWLLERGLFPEHEVENFYRERELELDRS